MDLEAQDLVFKQIIDASVEAVAECLRDLDDHDGKSFFRKETIIRHLGENLFKETKDKKYKDWFKVNSISFGALARNEYPYRYSRDYTYNEGSLFESGCE